MEESIYKMLVSNTAGYIKSEENQKDIRRGLGIDAFMASAVLSIALCKDKGEIITDIINSSK